MMPRSMPHVIDTLPIDVMADETSDGTLMYIVIQKNIAKDKTSEVWGYGTARGWQKLHGEPSSYFANSGTDK